MRASRTRLALILLIPVLGVSWFLSGCASTPTSASSTSAQFSQTDLIVGTGTTAASGNTLTVNYTGWLYDASLSNQKGQQFDAAAGFSFSLGIGQVIQGWDQGLVGMQVGGVRRLIIPPSLAYGGSRRQIIPANATLLFEIALTNVQ